MSTTAYCNHAESDTAGTVFDTLTFYETNRFQKDLRTGAFLSAGPEDRAFVAFISDASGATRANAECRILQPDGLPGALEAYGKPVIQIDCVYEDPEHEKNGAAEVLITALPGVVMDLYDIECRTLIFQPVPEVHNDMAGEPDYQIERFICRLGKLGKYKILTGGEFIMIENVVDAGEKNPALNELFAGYGGTYEREEVIRGVCGREMI